MYRAGAKLGSDPPTEGPEPPRPKEFDPETPKQGATQAAVKIISDNDLAGHGSHIEELASMKAKDKALGKFVSLGIWFNSAEAAEHTT